MGTDWNTRLTEREETLGFLLWGWLSTVTGWSEELLSLHPWRWFKAGGSWQLTVCAPAWSGGVDQTTSRVSLQPQPFSYSVHMIQRNSLMVFLSSGTSFLSRRLKHWVFNWVLPRFACGSCFWCFWGGMASDTIFNILQFIKSVGMACTVLHAQVCWDRNMLKIWL